MYPFDYARDNRHATMFQAHKLYIFEYARNGACKASRSCVTLRAI